MFHWTVEAMKYLALWALCAPFALALVFGAVWVIERMLDRVWPHRTLRPPPPPEPPPVAREVAPLVWPHEDRLRAIEDRVIALENVYAAEPEPTSSHYAAIGGRLGAVDSRNDRLEQRINDLRKDLADLIDDVDGRFDRLEAGS